VQHQSCAVWQVTTRAPEQTQALGAQLGRPLVGGEVIALSGPLGAGKTCLVQGIGEGLGVPDRITSPTFVLVHQHRGRIPLYHVDAYRLATAEAAYEIGLPELMDRGGVVAIEWAEQIAGALPDGRLDIEMAHVADGRIITLRPRSAQWEALVQELNGIAGPRD